MTHAFVSCPPLPSRRRPRSSSCELRPRRAAAAPPHFLRPVACAPPLDPSGSEDIATPAAAAAAAAAEDVAGRARKEAEEAKGEAKGEEAAEEAATGTPLSFSVGVTIVCGPNAALRKTVLEGLYLQGEAPIAVVSLQESAIREADREVKAAVGDGDSSVGVEAVADVDSAEEVVEAVDVSGEDEEERSEDGSGDIAVQDEDEGEVDAEIAIVESGADLDSGDADVATRTAWFTVGSDEALSEQVLVLAASRDRESILVDCPISVDARLLAQEMRHAGTSAFRVDCITCVLDSADVLDELSVAGSNGASAAASAEQADDADAANTTSAETAEYDDKLQGVPEDTAMLIVKCVECANFVAVTPSDAFPQTKSIISALNLGATVIQLEPDYVMPLANVVNSNLYDPDTVAINATWRRVLMPSSVPKAAKELTLVYRSRRPFHPPRLFEYIKDMSTFTGVIRSTGRIWLATRMEAPLEWEQAGNSATIRAGKQFLAAIPEGLWEISEARREAVMRDWDTQYGDRTTELVFVGVDFDKDRLQGLLDGCLLQDEEMVFNNLWENFDDPFEKWVPLDDGDSDEEEDSLAAAVQDQPQQTPPAQAAAPPPKDEAAADEAIPVAKADTGGEVDSEDLPDDLLNQASALDVFELGMGGHEEADGGGIDADGVSYKRISQPADDGAYDEDDVVVSSWDAGVADGIIQQMPNVGLPVTIVTGFLGAGKTTLLNYILTADHGLKIAVLVNEFGEVDIDNQLVEKGDWSSDDEVMELANGCICCSINDSFVSAVQKIVERGDSVDYLIVETTGVADPVPVINSLMVSDIAEDVRVDGILTLVDTENFDGKTHMGSEAALSQILAADTILLSKTDIAPREKVRETIEYVKEVRPAARILKSQRGRIPIEMILDVGLRIADSPAAMAPVKQEHSHDHDHDHDHKHDHDHDHDHDHEHEDDCSDPGCTDPTHDHSHDHSHDHEHDESCSDPECDDPTQDHSGAGKSNHLEEDGFVSTSFKSDRPLDAELFMERFMQHLPPGVFRAKGLLQFYGYAPMYVFNLSGRRYQFEEIDWPEGVAPSNQLVVIGRDLDIDYLRNTLEGCHATAKSEQS